MVCLGPADFPRWLPSRDAGLRCWPWTTAGHRSPRQPDRGGASVQDLIPQGKPAQQSPFRRGGGRAGRGQGMPPAVRRHEGRVAMIRFLYHNVKGHRLKVGVAIFLTFVAVASDVLIAFPFKFILDKIVNHKDPTVPASGAVMAFFDHFGDRSGLNGTELHTQVGVILFSGALLITLGVIGALVSYVQLSLAVRVGYDLGARLRNRLFVHLGR